MYCIARSTAIVVRAVWFTGDLGGVGPAVFLDALVMGPAEFDIGPAWAVASVACNCEPITN